jgi:flagellar biogenesis protein FliO
MRVIFVLALMCSGVAAASADDRMIQLAERFASRGVTDRISEPVGVVTAAATSPTPTESQPLGATPSAAGKLVSRNDALDAGSSWVMNTLTALGIVISLVLLARWAYTRFGGRVAVRSSPVIEVLSRTSVAPRNHVLLLRVGSRVLVVSDSPGGMRTLADLNDPQEVASLIGAVAAARDNSLSRNFTRMLHSFNVQHDERRADLDGGDDEEFTADRARNSISSLLSRVRLLSGRGGAA